MARFRPLDRLLLVLVVSSYGALFAAQLDGLVDHKAAFLPLYVSGAPTPSDPPRVRFVPETSRALVGSLTPGDDLVAIDGESLRGVGRLGFYARLQAAS